jgi:hypothetical protein
MGDCSDIVVVGVCGAGKSTLVRGLQALGYAARPCGQEHSCVPLLWRRHGQPLALVYLHAGLATVCRRLGVCWQENVLAVQRARLALAHENCDLWVDTDPLSIEEVLAEVVGYLRSRQLGAREAPGT